MTKKIQLLPAIDLIDGKPVRLLQGDFAQKTDFSQKFSLKLLAETFSHFADFIHVVDLDGAKNEKITNLKALEKIIHHSSIKIEVGGGIRTLKDLEILFDLGVERAILGTSALENFSFLQKALQKFGKEKIVVGIDTKKGLVATKAWESVSAISAKIFLQKLNTIGVKNIIYTQIESDGTLQGPPVELFKKLTTNFPQFNFYASGGVSHLNDLIALAKTKVKGIIFGRAFYENKITIDQLTKFSKMLK